MYRLMASAIVTSTVRAVAQLRARIHVLLPRAVSSMQSVSRQSPALRFAAIAVAAKCKDSKWNKK
jgi:hypothetical protein